MIVANELTKKESQYLDTQKKKASRSFALVVSYFEEPLKSQLATSYSIYRVVDNIEDCKEPYAWKKRRFEEFSVLMNDPTAAVEILPFCSREPWPGLTKDVSRGVSYVLHRQSPGQDITNDNGQMYHGCDSFGR